MEQLEKNQKITIKEKPNNSFSKCNHWIIFIDKNVTKYAK